MLLEASRQTARGRDSVNCWNRSNRGEHDSCPITNYRKSLILLIENHVDDGPDPDDARDAREDRVKGDWDFDEGEF